MIDIKKDVGDIKRFREIIGVLFDEGFSFLLENTKLGRFVPVSKKVKKKRKKESHPVRLRKTLERLGPTFIKFGQLLSVRPDLVPKEYIHELEKLQDDVPSFPFSKVKETIEESIGKKIEKVFRSIDKKPIASASMAQVHKGVLLNGAVVAVKIRKPGIEITMEQDIEIMHFIAGLLEKHVNELKKYRPTAIVDEFSRWTKKELDFVNEGNNIKYFYRNFQNSKTTKIPKLYDEYLDTKLIVMEYVDGTELLKVDKTKFKGLKKALENGFNSVLQQVFEYGLFHGDPHSSNVLVMKDNRVCFVDFGIVGRFDDKLKERAADIMIGIGQGDSEQVVEALLDISETEEGINKEDFNKEMAEIILPLRESRIENIQVSRVFEEALDTSLHYGLRIPKEFVLFGKSIMTLEGIALMYYPDFKIGEMLNPFLEEYVSRKYDPENVAKRSIKDILNLKRIAQKLPGQTQRVLEKLEKGKIKLEMKDTDIEKLSVELDKSSNRLTYGMIIAALLISGSLVITVGNPIYYGVPLLSTICFIAAGFVGLMLIISIIRGGPNG